MFSFLPLFLLFGGDGILRPTLKRTTSRALSSPQKVKQRLRPKHFPPRSPLAIWASFLVSKLLVVSGSGIFVTQTPPTQNPTGRIARQLEANASQSLCNLIQVETPQVLDFNRLGSWIGSGRWVGNFSVLFSVIWNRWVSWLWKCSGYGWNPNKGWKVDVVFFILSGKKSCRLVGQIFVEPACTWQIHAFYISLTFQELNLSLMLVSGSVLSETPHFDCDSPFLHLGLWGLRDVVANYRLSSKLRTGDKVFCLDFV